MAWRWFDDFYPPPSRPRAVKGGIKAQSKRGTFGESWWAKRWIAVLEGFNIGARLGRGRSYARRGQVVSITIDKGRVKAGVQGSQPLPYQVTIALQTLALDDWDKLIDALSQQAIFASKLLAGEMPQDIEAVFTDVGLSLFPTRLKDLATDCSCPDWSNPCKHVAAVYYLLGEEFDRDPFLLFRLRGMNREELLERLHSYAQGLAPGQEISTPATEGRSTPQPPEPLTSDSSRFWGGATLPDDLFGEVRVPSIAAAVPKRLGSFPFWRGQTHFLEAMQAIYAQAALHGLDLFLGTRGRGEEAEDEAPPSITAAAPPRPRGRRGLPRRRL
jgi:uncharacterized Zn finger protein